MEINCIAVTPDHFNFIIFLKKVNILIENKNKKWTKIPNYLMK